MESYRIQEEIWKLFYPDVNIVLKSYTCPNCGLVLKYDEKCSRCI